MLESREFLIESFMVEVKSKMENKLGMPLSEENHGSFWKVFEDFFK